MLNVDFLKQLLIISTSLSIITCAFIQKTKSHFKKSKYLPLYSLLVNLIIGVVFCFTFTTIAFPTSLWVGLFSFVEADSLYKTLEGKLTSHSEILNRKNVTIAKENLINKEEKDGKATISK